MPVVDRLQGLTDDRAIRLVLRATHIGWTHLVIPPLWATEGPRLLQLMEAGAGSVAYSLYALPPKPGYTIDVVIHTIGYLLYLRARMEEPMFPPPEPNQLTTGLDYVALANKKREFLESEYATWRQKLPWVLETIRGQVWWASDHLSIAEREIARQTWKWSI